jgi:hypothetical protein
LGRGGDGGDDDDGGATVEWIGVDAHVAIRGDGTIGGRVVGAARTISMEESPDRRRRRRGEGGGEGGGGLDDHPVVTEILAWCDFDIGGGGGGGDGGIAGTGGAAAGRGRYDRKYVCRAAGSFYCMDVCASHLKVYVAFRAGCCPFLRRGGGAADYSGRAEEYSAARRRWSIDIEEEGSMGNEDCGDASRSYSAYRSSGTPTTPPRPPPPSPPSRTSHRPTRSSRRSTPCPPSRSIPPATPY